MARLTCNTNGDIRIVLTGGDNMVPSGNVILNAGNEVMDAAGEAFLRDIARVTIPSIEETPSEQWETSSDYNESNDYDSMGRCNCADCREARGEVTEDSDEDSEEAFDHVEYVDNVLDILTHGTLTRRGKTPVQGINETGVAEVTYDGVSVRAIFKVCGGNPTSTRAEGNAEMAVRWLARYFPYVDLPACTMRDFTELGYAGFVGCVQHFVPNTVTAWARGEEWHMRDEIQDIRGTEAFRTAAIGATLFDMLIGNSDRHGYNWLLRTECADNERPIVLIDHGDSYVFRTDESIYTAADFAAVVECEVIPAEMRAALRAIADMDLSPLADFGLRARQLQSLQVRAEKLANMALVSRY